MVDIDDHRQKLIMKYSDNKERIKKVNNIISKLNTKIMMKHNKIVDLQNDIKQINTEYIHICKLFYEKNTDYILEIIATNILS